MRRKALVIGAPPSAWEGPIIRLDGGKKWLVEPQADYRGAVLVRYQPRGEAAPVERLLNNEEVIIERALFARVVILEEIESVNVSTVSVNVRCLEA